MRTGGRIALAMQTYMPSTAVCEKTLVNGNSWELLWSKPTSQSLICQ